MLVGVDHYLTGSQQDLKAHSVLGIAEIRCSLKQFIHVFHQLIENKSSEGISCQEEIQQLLTAIRESKLKPELQQRVFSFDVFTAFLLRMTTRKYGYSTLLSINGMNEIQDNRILLPSVYNYVRELKKLW